MRYRVLDKKDNSTALAIKLESGRYTIRYDNGGVKEVAASTFKRWFRITEELKNEVSDNTQSADVIAQINKEAAEAKRKAVEMEEKRREEKRKQWKAEKEAIPELDAEGLVPGITSEKIRDMMHEKGDFDIIMKHRLEEQINSKNKGRYKHHDSIDFLGFNLIVVYSHVWIIDVRLFDRETEELLFISPTHSLAKLFDLLNLDKLQRSRARREIKKQRDNWDISRGGK